MEKVVKLPQSKSKIHLKNKNPSRGLHRYKERLESTEENEKIWSEVKTNLKKARSG